MTAKIHVLNAGGPAHRDDSLRFEHLVEINDPKDPRLTPMTRAQLYRGLQIRAEFPKTFVPWLDECEIRRIDEKSLLRTLHFGAQTVREHVHFDCMNSVKYETIEEDANVEFRLAMVIEEPEPDHLFVRFTYEAHSPTHRDSDPHAGAIKEAYRLADIDTVFRIRQLADSGVLDE